MTTVMITATSTPFPLSSLIADHGIVLENQDMLRFHYIMAVWGKRYRQLFIEIVLPTLLSPGNLSGCRYRTNSVFKIYTLAEDAVWLDQHPLLRRLRSSIAVEFHVIAPEHESFIREENAYQAMSVFHRHAIRQAVEENAYLVFMTADAIVSDGAFRTLEDQAAAGVDCVVLCGIRCALEEAEPQIRAWLAETAEAPRLTSRQMTDLLLSHPHRLARGIQWGALPFNSRSPGHVYWFGERGILAHGWHLHPWMIRAEAGTENFIGTIDSDYVANAEAAGLRIHVVQDSDDLCVVELSPADHLSDMLEGQGAFDLTTLQIWAIMACNSVHRDFFKLPILFKGSGYEDSTFAATREAAAEIVSELHARIEEALEETREITSLDELRGHSAIYLYGNGQFGRTMLALIRAAGIDTVRGFIDSDTDGQCEGLPVHALEHFRAIHQPDDLILICSQFISSILERLTPLRPARVLTCYTFHLAHTKRHLRDARIIRWSPHGADPTRLSIHGIGSRGEGLALPSGQSFADDFLCFNYEPDGDAIEQTALFHQSQGIRQTTFSVAVAGRDGRDRLILNYDPFTSSLLAFNDAYQSFYCAYDLPNADYPFKVVCAPVRFLDVPVIRLDTLCRREGIGLDYAAIDTQGTELDVLEGMGMLADTSLLAFTAEVEFHPLYAGQKLFEDILDFARRHGFHLVRMDAHPAGSFLRGPIGWRGRGFTPSADALFIKDISQLCDAHPAPRRSLMKLAFLTFCFGNSEYALDCLRRADQLPPEVGDETLEARGYVRFLRGLQLLLADDAKVWLPGEGDPSATGQNLDKAVLSGLLDPAATPFESYLEEHGFTAMAEGIRSRRLRDAWGVMMGLGLAAPGTVGSVRELINLDELRGHSTIYLYGSGRLGRTLLGLIRAAGIGTVHGFIDSNTDGECEGLPVHALERFRAIHHPDDLIVICSQFIGAILERLKPLEPVKLLSSIDFYKAYMSYGLPERRLFSGSAAICRDPSPVTDPTFLTVHYVGSQNDGLALPAGSPFAGDLTGFDPRSGCGPDYVAIRAPGSELAILEGMGEDGAIHLLAFTTTGLLHPDVAGQGLFEDTLRFARRHGFHLVQTDQHLDGAFSPAPIGWRHTGLTFSADILFFKDIAVLQDSHPAPRRALLKLAFLALCFERLEYALECLEAADHLAPADGDEAIEARSYVRFLRGLGTLFTTEAIKLQPTTFSDLFSAEDSFARFAPGGRADGFDPSQVRQRYFSSNDLSFVRIELPRLLDPNMTPLEDYLRHHGFTTMAETVRINRLRHARTTAAALGVAGREPWPDPAAVRTELERLPEM